MRRLFVSILLGILLPLLYTMIVAPLSVYIPYRVINHYAALPIRWPVIIADALGPIGLGIIQLSDSSLLLLAILGNIVVYSTVVYFVLLAISRKRTMTERPPATPRSS
jgi:hypothetical protein